MKLNSAKVVAALAFIFSFAMLPSFASDAQRQAVLATDPISVD